VNAQGVIPPGFKPIPSENPFGAAAGPVYEKTGKGGWVRGCRIEKRHTNRAGVAHGGMLMTFADIVLARAVADVAKGPFATIEIEAKFVSPAVEGAWIEGRARVLRATREVAFVEGSVVSKGNAVLAVSGVFKFL
jgi:uncharacterized protein (TIGR00369 family)